MPKIDYLAMLFKLSKNAFIGPLKEHPTHTIGNAFEYSHQFNEALWDDFFLDSENKFFFKKPFNIHTASPENWKQLLLPFTTKLSNFDIFV